MRKINELNNISDERLDLAYQHNSLQFENLCVNF